MFFFPRFVDEVYRKIGHYGQEYRLHFLFEGVYLVDKHDTASVDFRKIKRKRPYVL